MSNLHYCIILKGAEFDHRPSGIPLEEDYNRLQSTRLGHYQDKDITPRFDKSIELER